MGKQGEYMYRSVLELMNKNDDVLRSPNNIRRLVLSSKGAIVVLHVPVSGAGKDIGLIKCVRFDTKLAQECLSSSDYIPMLQTVIDKGVCSSIENIVFCVSDVNGRASLISKDTDMSVLTKGYDSTSVEQRFSRLESCIYSNWSIETWFEFLQANQDPAMSLTDYPSVRSHAKVYSIIGSKWRGHYSLRPKNYRFEEKGGLLHRHFLEVDRGKPKYSPNDIYLLAQVWTKLKRVYSTMEILNVLAVESGDMSLIPPKKLSLCNYKLIKIMDKDWISHTKTKDTIEQSCATNYDRCTDYFFWLYYWTLDLMLKKLHKIYVSDQKRFKEIVEYNKGNFAFVIHNKNDFKKYEKALKSMGLNLGHCEADTEFSQLRILRILVDVMNCGNCKDKITNALQYKNMQFSHNMLCE